VELILNASEEFFSDFPCGMLCEIPDSVTMSTSERPTAANLVERVDTLKVGEGRTVLAAV
jgi:hypothetical protein